MNVGTVSPRGKKHMANDLPDTIVQLGDAAVIVQRGADTVRLQVHTASLSVLPSRRRARLRFEGPAGSVTLELSRFAFWRLTSAFHESSIAAETCPKRPPRSARRRRS